MKTITVGQKFGRLTVKERHGQRKGSVLWLCSCACGKEKVITGGHLLGGNTKSCGCWLKDFKVTHGMSGSETYNTWEHMKRRCNSVEDKRYKDYGGRGIKVCERWEKFENFYEDMGERPKGMTIDRADNDGNYEKKNCIWATPSQQSRNTRSNRMIKYRGEERCLTAWAEELDVNRSTLIKRIDRGWSIPRAFNEGVRNA